MPPLFFNYSIFSQIYSLEISNGFFVIEPLLSQSINTALTIYVITHKKIQNIETFVKKKHKKNSELNSGRL